MDQLCARINTDSYTHIAYTAPMAMRECDMPFRVCGGGGGGVGDGVGLGSDRERERDKNTPMTRGQHSIARGHSSFY